MIVEENRRLAREVYQLRQRTEAFESSRWWRLHPRFAVRRMLARVPIPEISDGHVQGEEAEPVRHRADTMAEKFRRDVLLEGSFSQDWFTPHIPRWEKFLAPLEGRSARILEIGSFEGLSACFFLWRLPDARITCIDTFAGAPDYPAYGISTIDLERRFDANVSLVDASRVAKRAGDSRRILLDLVTDATESFDVIYVDGSHMALDVVVDAALSWQLLSENGLLIFDDYGGGAVDPDPLRHVKPAVDAFLELVSAHSTVLVRERQVVVRKRQPPSSALESAST